ncbi:MAG: hypothetical protein ACLTZM_00785 [Ruminococcus sp.]
MYTVINGGALSAISYALDDIKGETADIAIDVALDSLVTKLPWVALVNTSFKFSVGLSNILFNIKDIQKQKDKHALRSIYWKLYRKMDDRLPV